MANRPSIAVLNGLRKAFLSLRTVHDLAELLQEPQQQLTAHALNPKYYVFNIPKKNGEKRLIEDPADSLQKIQSALNDYLQAVHWFQRNDSVYGFIIQPSDDPSPRQIEANARVHLGKPWLLNCDLEDFFHQITASRVESLLLKEPFCFDAELAHLLTGLCTFNGRCPMGSPVSPVLSNLVFAPVDAALRDLSQRRGWTYSRYADDMSFSCSDLMTWDDYTAIKKVVTTAFGFEYNEEKARLLGPGDEKIITGLMLTFSGVEVPPSFLPALLEEIKELDAAVNVQFKAGRGRSNQSIERFQRVIEGKMQFYRRIMGYKDNGMKALERAYSMALQPPDDLQMRSWRDFDFY